MANRNRTNEAAQKLAEGIRDSYQAMLDHAVGIQERNVRFMQGMVDDAIKELRYQAESNRAFTQELAERAERQREAFQQLVEEGVEAYLDLLYAPFTYYREGLEAVSRVAR
ncbi:hypothetical protein [Rubrobacter calidifluminis]|uniref:hypothetical protein n=1 Tax=Rubrobacter calidifluminis TaxID=1392640 RepID=UPI002362782C|nr:hypothetical protein [Rubrobacter calidifluminis]